MGLPQKRILKDFQDNAYPDLLKKLQSAAGFEVPVEVKWDTMMSDKYEKKEQYFEWYNKVYFQSLTETFSNLTKDDMGREALKGGLKKVILESSPEHSTFRGTTFKDGILHVKHSFHTNVDNVRERVEAWTKLLEKSL